MHGSIICLRRRARDIIFFFYFSCRIRVLEDSSERYLVDARSPHFSRAAQLPQCSSRVECAPCCARLTTQTAARLLCLAAVLSKKRENLLRFDSCGAQKTLPLIQMSITRNTFGYRQAQAHQNVCYDPKVREVLKRSGCVMYMKLLARAGLDDFGVLQLCHRRILSRLGIPLGPAAKIVFYTHSMDPDDPGSPAHHDDEIDPYPREEDVSRILPSTGYANYGEAILYELADSDGRPV